ncbi:MAG: hypothetical protein ACU0DW_10185 [Shimia sp.]
MVALPAVLLPQTTSDTAQIVALIAVFAGLIVFVEYASDYPSLLSFRHAAPFNRIRFVMLFVVLFLLTVIYRGEVEPSAFTELALALGQLLAAAIDFPYSPVRNMVLMLPADASEPLVTAVRVSSAVAYTTSLCAVGAFLVVLRANTWPGRNGTFNVWINLPTFDPTAGGDVVLRLQRDARISIIGGFLLPFVIPALAKAGAQVIDSRALDNPQTLIWVVTLWACLPASLLMRGIAMGRIASMIEDQRRRRYAEVDEDGVLV